MSVVQKAKSADGSGEDGDIVDGIGGGDLEEEKEKKGVTYQDLSGNRQ